jgi:hypothetical protein
MRLAERQRHDVPEPVQLVCIEIATDQLRTCLAGGIVNDRLQLIETFLRVDTGVEMHIPNAQVAPRRSHSRAEGKPIPGAEAQIARLEARDPNARDRIAADNPS